MLVDLRSDTVTKPTQAMLDFMLRAPVGDDVFGEDPTVLDLEHYAAELFGKEAGLFCPSGTMSNQIAIKTQTQPSGEVICETGAHIYYYEGGGIAFNSGCTTKTIIGERGVFTAEQLEHALRPSDIHFPRTQLVSVENTCNRGGGKIFDLAEIKQIRDTCLRNDLALHLDGARVFNALVATGTTAREIGDQFDSISVCLSKGLGAPVGSVLLGDSKLIDHGKRVRKVLGGGMRQAGIMAAGGLFALKNNIDRLDKDHELAKNIEKEVQNKPYVERVLQVETNMVVFELKSQFQATDFLKHLDNHNIKALTVGNNSIRFVTHLDIPNTALKTISVALSSF